MLSQKLYPLLSATHKGRNGPRSAGQRRPAMSWTSVLAVWLWNYLGCTPAMSEGLCYVVCVYGYRRGHLRSILCISNSHLQYCYCLQGFSAAFQPSADHILCRLLTLSVARAAYTYLARKPAGTFWCMVHHTCFNHSVSQTPPRRGLLQHITKNTQLVI